MGIAFFEVLHPRRFPMGENACVGTPGFYHAGTRGVISGDP